jgi:CBS domain-containing protein
MAAAGLYVEVHEPSQNGPHARRGRIASFSNVDDDNLAANGESGPYTMPLQQRAPSPRGRLQSFDLADQEMSATAGKDRSPHRKPELKHDKLDVPLPQEDSGKCIPPPSPVIRPQQVPAQLETWSKLLNYHLLPTRDWETRARKATIDIDNDLLQKPIDDATVIEKRKVDLRKELDRELRQEAAILADLKRKESRETVKVEAAMKPLNEVATCRTSDALGAAAVKMLHSHQNCLLVVDEAGVQGAITPRDLLRAFSEHCATSEVSAWLAKHEGGPRLCPRGTLLIDAAVSMAEHRVHHLVIVESPSVSGGTDEDTNIIGVLSSLDLAYAIAPTTMDGRGEGYSCQSPPLGTGTRDPDPASLGMDDFNLDGECDFTLAGLESEK